MEIIDSLTFALRAIVAGSGGAVSRSEYQCAGELPPDKPFYVREAVIPMGAAVVNQRATRYDFVAQYDCFARRDAYPDPVRFLHDKAGEIAALFSTPEQPFGKTVTLGGWTGAECFVTSPADVQGIGDRDGYFQLPVLVNISVIADASAKYAVAG